MIRYKLDEFMSKRRVTLLGLGPMSKNCVDMIIKLANDYDIPIMMIASRNQIDSEEFGGGYVNDWSTERFAEYVIDNDKKGKIILARDHGGPWQNKQEREKGLSLRRAMESAKRSFKVDIECGFEAIHIDPSVDIHGHPSVDDVLHRIFDLYQYCWDVAQACGREIIFEIGTEEQNGSTNTPEELEYVLGRMNEYCAKNGLPDPTFVVIQTGTRVKEMKNVGSFDSPIRVANELPAEISVPKMIEICNRHNIYMKQHNTDYLGDESLSWIPKLGIHSANVAPELGVIETRSFMRVLSDNAFKDLYDAFVSLSLRSEKWQKWMLPESTATDEERAMIAGHYNYSDPEYVRIKREAQLRLKKEVTSIDDVLKTEIEAAIMRYLRHFMLVWE